MRAQLSFQKSGRGKPLGFGGVIRPDSCSLCHSLIGEQSEDYALHGLPSEVLDLALGQMGSGLLAYVPVETYGGVLWKHLEDVIRCG